jgi:ATP-dependent Lhr-like helicase
MWRDHLPWLLPPEPEGANAVLESVLGSNALAAYEAFLRHGALFPAQIGSLLQLVAAQVQEVLGELAAAGLVTSDGFPALRTLIGSKSGGKRMAARRKSSMAASHAGRWTLLRSALTPPVAAPERTEQWCRLLLRRYGVMFRDLLGNESAAPPWHELVRTYRRLEARGEIRGGRFVANVSGEQYALPEVIGMLRAGEDALDVPVILPATDPLNLTGCLGTSPRVPAAPGHSVMIVQGQVSEYAVTNDHQLPYGLVAPEPSISGLPG